MHLLGVKHGGLITLCLRTFDRSQGTVEQLIIPVSEDHIVAKTSYDTVIE
jgi:hypothetical protein